MTTQIPGQSPGTLRPFVQYPELETLISTNERKSIVGQVADQIVDKSAIHTDELTFVLVMNGALFFASDVIRFVERKIPSRVESLRAKSYQGTEAGELQLSQLPDPASIAGRHVWILDDIFDTGATLQRVCETIEQMEPASVSSAVMLRKIGCKRDDVQRTPDVVGRDIPDLFVVGYGLDLDGRYRGLNHIAVRRELDKDKD